MVRIILLLLFLITAPSRMSTCMASEITVNPEETRIVLSILLSAANQPIPVSCASCPGHYGQQGRVKIKDILSLSLAYLYQGENKIIGTIHGTGNVRQCELTMTHINGEDVSSFRIMFSTREGKMLLNTLSCFNTP